MNTIDLFLGCFGTLCGIYCLYSYMVMSKDTSVLKQSLLMGKGIDIRKCRDKRGFVEEMLVKVLVLGIVITAYSALEIILGLGLMKEGIISTVGLMIFCATIIWYYVQLSGATKRYFYK